MISNKSSKELGDPFIAFILLAIFLPNE